MSVLERMDDLVRNENFHVAMGQVSDVLTNFILTPAIVFAVTVYIFLRNLVVWKLEKPGPVSNFAVLLGQLMLGASLCLCYHSINVFHSMTFSNSFLYGSISCCLHVFSMFVCYDFRYPPYQKFGLFLSAFGTVLNLYAAFYMYDSEWNRLAHIPYILGLHVFVIGATILCMHLLKAVYETANAEIKEA